jgi:hypothetical protein
MKQILFSLALTPFLANFAQANDIAEPDLNQCNANKNIQKCEIICKRKLGEQCLITHVNFEGNNLSSKTQLFRAKFKTCKNANLDLQIKSLAIELEKLDERETEAKITSSVSASGKRVSLDTHAPIEFNQAKIDGRLSRIYFNKLISSGESFVESEITLQQCGHEDGKNSCKISGTLVAVTDPNIRCDFHDTTQPGSYLPATFKFSPNLYSGQHPVGRTGE